MTSGTLQTTGSYTPPGGSAVTVNNALVLANPLVMNDGAFTFSGTAALTFTGVAALSGPFNLLTDNISGGVTLANTISDGAGGPGR